MIFSFLFSWNFKFDPNFACFPSIFVQLSHVPLDLLVFIWLISEENYSTEFDIMSLKNEMVSDYSYLIQKTENLKKSQHRVYLE